MKHSSNAGGRVELAREENCVLTDRLLTNEQRGFDMTHYLVTARLESDRFEDLVDNLRNNVYASMRPFGKTLTYSLRNARRFFITIRSISR
jgi:hypothetical protein